MSLVVENGTGVPGATSYVALADADAHFSGLAHSAWVTATETSREYALTLASEYADIYEYPGQTLTINQGLKWPRRSARDRDGRTIHGIPVALRTAVLEQASQYVQRPATGFDDRQILKEKIGPVELMYAQKGRQPSFVFRLLMKIGARPASTIMKRG